MPERFLREEIRTDYRGAYTAYLYADGHVETDPPGRPISKEDWQRHRLNQATAEKVARMTTAARTAAGARGIPMPSDIKQAERSVPTLRALTQGFHDTLNAASVLAQTARTPMEMRHSLVASFDLGGPAGGPVEYNEEEAYPGPVNKQAATPPAFIRRVR